MANWDNPTLSSLYTDFVDEVKNRDSDAARQFRVYGTNTFTGSGTTVVGTIRFDGTKWLTWNGTLWEALVSEYDINVTTLKTFAPSTTGGANTIPLCNNNTQLQLSADLLDGFHAGNVSGAIPISNGTLNVNLNSDLLDSKTAGNANGNIPISNSTVCVNLNADMLDGNNASNASGDIPISNGIKNVNLNADMLDGLTSGNDTGNIPVSNGTLNVNLNADMVDSKTVGNANGNIPISNGAVNTNLNADMLDGNSAAYFSAAHTHPYLPTAGGTITGDLTITGTLTESSDIALKYDINPIENALDSINKLKGSTYRWKSNDKSSIGLIAQEVATVLPDAVTYNEDGEANGVQYTRLIAVLIEAVKDLNKKLENK